MSTATKRLHQLALTCYLALTIWFVLWQFVISVNHSYSLIFRLLWILPLLLPLTGMFRAKPYTHAWASFVVLIYLIHGLTGVYALQAERLYAAIEIVLSLLSLVLCSLYARKRGQELGMGLQKLSKVMEQERQHFEGNKDARL